MLVFFLPGNFRREVPVLFLLHHRQARRRELRPPPEDLAICDFRFSLFGVRNSKLETRYFGRPPDPARRLRPAGRRRRLRRQMLVINRRFALAQVPRYLFQVLRADREPLPVALEFARVGDGNFHQAVSHFGKAETRRSKNEIRMASFDFRISNFRKLPGHLNAKLFCRTEDLRVHRRLRRCRKIRLAEARQAVPNVRCVMDGQLPFARLRARRRISKIFPLHSFTGNRRVILIGHFRSP